MAWVYFLHGLLSKDTRPLSWVVSSANLHDTGCPFQLEVYMSRKRWEDICCALRDTLKPSPMGYVQKFHPLQEFQDAFNEHYQWE